MQEAENVLKPAHPTPEMQAMQALVEEELRKLEAISTPTTTLQTSIKPRYGPYYEAAAVLSTFESSTLKPVEGTIDKESIKALLFDSIPIHDFQKKDRWTLSSEIRRDVLLQMGNQQTLLRALAANPERPDDPVQKMLEAYIRGDAPSLDTQNAQQIAATSQVAEWLRGTVDNIPDQEAIQQRQELCNLLQPFYDLAGTHFRGRQQELQRLRDYVGVLPPGSLKERIRRIADKIFNFQDKPPIVIYGIGGIGKSTLVARFIWEHATLPDTERFPWVYIDFDRPGLLAEEPLTLLIEAVRQLGIQYPDARVYCDRFRTSIQQEMAQHARLIRSVTMNPGRDNEVIATLSRPQDWERFLKNFASLLKNLKVETAPFLLVLDTFEEVQYRSSVTVLELYKFLQVFQSHVPRLRTVLVGRAPLTGFTDYPTQEVKLEDFDPAAAQGFLEAHGLPPTVAKNLSAQVSGNPLSLKLVAEVWRRERTNADNLIDLQIRRVRQEEIEIQGILFTRILSHIHDDDVRKLAHPGLVLRRVTPDLIREVLAGPCGIVLNHADDAKRLFDEMKREVALVTLENGVIHHRSDVRRIMIRLLRAKEPEKVRRIEENAVAYYEKFNDPEARAEEIYHRLSLKQPASILDARWIDGIGIERYLHNALDELSVREKAWLAPRLQITLTPYERAQADLEGWERDTEQRVRELLQRNRAQQALVALRERPERTSGSSLYMLEAQALESLERWEEARRIIKEGITTTTDSALAIDQRIRCARLDIRLGDFPSAHQNLNEAELLIKCRGDDPIRLLEIGLNRLGLHHAEGKDVQGDDISDLETQLCDWFDHLSDEQVAKQPALMAWFACELGEKYPACLLRIVRLNKLETKRQRALRNLSRALAAWDGEFSEQHHEPPGLLGRQVNISESDTVADTWTKAILQATADTLTQIVVQLLESFSVIARPVQVAIIDILCERAPETLTPQITPKTEGRIGQQGTIPSQIPLPTSYGRPYSETTAEYAMAGLKLNNHQMRQFREALLDAFPTRDSLSEMLRFRLDRNLETLVLSDDLATVIVRLIMISQEEGWSAQLLVAARESRPQNARLLAFAEQFGLAPSVQQPQSIERAISKENSSLNLAQWRTRLGQLETQVCRVEINTDGVVSFSTGFLLGPNMLITTYHTTEGLIKGKANPQDVRLRFDYKQLVDGMTINPGTVYRLNSDWLIDYSPHSQVDLQQETNLLPQPDELDYALLRIAGAPGIEPVGGERAERDAPQRGWIKIPTYLPDLSPNTPLFILLHPEGAPLQLSLATEGVIGLNANGTRVWYKANTTAGSSGAPCFNSNWDLIALHHAKSRRANNTIYDQGIPLKAILNLLESKGLKHILDEQQRLAPPLFIEDEGIA